MRFLWSCGLWLYLGFAIVYPVDMQMMWFHYSSHSILDVFTYDLLDMLQKNMHAIQQDFGVHFRNEKECKRH